MGLTNELVYTIDNCKKTENPHLVVIFQLFCSLSVWLSCNIGAQFVPTMSAQELWSKTVSTHNSISLKLQISFLTQGKI